MSQLSLQHGEAAASHAERTRGPLRLCLLQLATVARGDAFWRALNGQVIDICYFAVLLSFGQMPCGFEPCGFANTQILGACRDDVPAVRVAALRVLEGLYERLGDEYLAFVPETIPTIAELLDGAYCIFIRDVSLSFCLSVNC